MAAKRPSYVSIRARQRRILDYQLSTGKKDKETAKEFGVTTAQLRKFVESDPKKLRRSYNRSPNTKKLYSEGQEKEVRKMVRKEHVPYQRTTVKVSYPKLASLTEEKELEDYYHTASRVEYLYAWEVSPSMAKSHQWEIYTSRLDLPISIDSINAMHDRGDIDDAAYDRIISRWRAIYGIRESVSA